MFTGDDGKYRALLSVISDTVMLSSVIWMTTVPIPSDSRSVLHIVATHLWVQGILSLKNDVSLAILMLAALSTINVIESILNLWQ